MADTQLGLAEGGAFASGINTGLPVETAFSGPRRAADKDDDDTPPADPEGPMENPIGDGVWAMLVMATGYLIYRVRTRKREVMA